MIKRITAILVGLGILLLAVFLIYAWEASIPEREPPSQGDFSDAMIEQGEALAGIGNCQSCHTVDPEQPLAGGRAFPTDFGTLYSTNITPDPATGIGTWSREAFHRAMRQGISRNGAHHFPAFPYTHYTKVSDEDLDALYAYLMTREPINAEPPDNHLRFPFNIRLLQAGWKLLFFEQGRFEPDESRSELWNRGAYLAEGLGHCSACHTPRNDFGAEQSDLAYEGAVINNWYAPALNTSSRAPVDWTEASLYDYLRSGGSTYHGVAVGSMADVVHRGLGKAEDRDIRALASYFSAMAEPGSDEQARQTATATIQTAQQRSAETLGYGEKVFTYACASCHYNDPNNPSTLRPDLSLNTALRADNPMNLIRVTLEGVGNEEGLPGVVMPAFAELSNADISALLHFLRATHTDRPAWDNLEEEIERQRQEVVTNTEAAR